MSDVEWPDVPVNANPRGTPLVSVVVAAFNAAAYIDETCRSVLAQTYRSLELIVVDDGSTDDTGGVVLALARSDTRIRLIRQQNRGVAAARNAGIAAASGEFIAPLDADDLWDRRKIERQVERLLACGPGTGFVYCWWAWIDMGGRILDRSPRWRAEGRVLERLVEINFTGNASVPLFRRACIEEVGGYDVTLRDRQSQGCEDWDLVIRVAERYAVAVVPEVLVGYRRRADGMSTACDTMLRSQTHVMAGLAARHPDLSASVLRRSRQQFALHLAGVAFWSGRYLEAWRWGMRAPLTVAVQILPYMFRTFARRLLPDHRDTAVLAPGDVMFDEARMSEPLIPYHRIYGRRWRR